MCFFAYLRLVNLKRHIIISAGTKNGRKNRQNFLRSIFNVAHRAAPDCIVLLPIRVDYVT